MKVDNQHLATPVLVNSSNLLLQQYYLLCSVHTEFLIIM